MNLKKTLPALALMLALVATMGITVAASLTEVSDCPSGMVSYWKFDEDFGTTAYDSYDSNHGTINGATWTASQVGGALSFDGNDYVDVGNDANLILPSALSMGVWIKTTQTGINKRIISKWGWNGEIARYLLQMGGGEIDFCIHPGETICVDSTGTVVNDDVWHFIAATWDGSIMKLYIDATLVSSTPRSGTLTSSINGVFIGAESGGGYYFNGLIDEPAIYDKALTAKEILQHYNNGLIGKGYCETEWNNHGAYVSCVAKEAKLLFEQELITKKEKGEIISEAAQSDVGKYLINKIKNGIKHLFKWNK